MRVCVTGASGFLGGHLVAVLSERAFVLALDRASLSPERIEAMRPDCVIHLAALTDPGFCQNHGPQALETNAALSERLARAAASSVTRFIYASTDLVFDGRAGSYTEADAPAPISVYGESKLAGETAVRARLGDRALVARLPLMYGPRRLLRSRPSFAEVMIDRGLAGEPVDLFEDEYRSPLYVEDAAESLARLAVTPPETDLIHLGGPERCSRYEMGLAAFEVMGIPRSLARASRQADHPGAVHRPPDVSFNSGYARRLGLPGRSIREGFLSFRDRMKTPFYR